jgi:hypothetical protein
MASRLDFSQIRSLYVGTSSNVTVGTDNLVVAGSTAIGTTSAFTFGGTAKLSVYADAPITFALSNTDAVYFRRYGVGQYQFQTTNSGGNTGDLSLQSYGGNVGIGTATPSYKLDVAGTIAINSGQSFVYASYDNVAALFQRVGTYGAVIQIGRSGVSSSTTIDYPTDGTFAVTTAGSERMRIDASGNVGIGTTSPGSKLDVISSSTQIADFRSTVTDGLSNIRVVNDQQTTASGTSPAAIELVGKRGSSTHGRHAWIGAEGVDGTTFRTQIKFKVRPEDSPYQWSTLPTQMVIDGNGNVGIGTTTPASQLGVFLPNATGGGISLQAISGTTYGKFGLVNPATDNNTYIGSITNNDFLLYTNNSEKVRITAGGNVGIGTTSPSEKLHVYGNLKVDGQTFMTSGFSSYTTDGLFNANALWNGVITPSGVYRIRLGYLDQGGGQYWGRIGFVANTNWSLGTSQGGNSFSIGTGNGNNEFLIDNAGNVGIGTTSPNAKLDVRGTTLVYANTNIGLYNSGGNALFHQFESYWDTNAAGSIATLRFDVGTWRLWSAGTGAAVVTVKSDGNVGIGTTSPSAPLHVKNPGDNGGVRYTVFLGQNSTGYQNSFVASVQDELTDLGAGIVGTNTGSNLSFSTHPNGGALTERMRITKTGNVGIGTASPNEKLQVTSGDISIRSSSGAWGSLRFGTTNSSYLTEWAGIESDWEGVGVNVANLKFYTSYGSIGERMRITSGGNVGIGTTAPAGKLQIVDGSSGTTNDSSTTLYVENSGTSNSFYVLQTASVGGGKSFSITNAGNVGIGTTSPDAKLVVVGSGTGVVKIGDAGFGSGNYTGISLNGTLSTSNYNILSSPTDSTLYINRPTGATIQFRENNTTQVIIAASGNVGIGTTSPTHKLQVVGPGTFASTATAINGNVGLYMTIGGSANNYNGILFQGVSVADMYFGRAAGAGVDDLIIFGGGELVRFKQNGNVGIGTTAPLEKLHVSAGHIVIENTYAVYMNGSDTNWGVGRNIVTDSGFLTGNALQAKVFNGTTQGFQVVNSSNTALFEVEGNTGRGRIIGGFAVGSITPSTTAGRIDASNDVVAYSTSDSRLKENITPIANALDKVKSLTGVEFDWKEETKDVHGYEGHDVGVIAQEVQAVLPEAIRTNDSGYLSVRYEKMIALLIEGMKEQQNQIDELKAKLDGLTK